MGRGGGVERSRGGRKDGRKVAEREFNMCEMFQGVASWLRESAAHDGGMLWARLESGRWREEGMGWGRAEGEAGSG